jgi:antitoxin component HigA of HigAB toxin-antitoxin module
MRIISRKALREFWEIHPAAEQPLEDWYRITKHAEWSNLVETRLDFLHADPVGECTVVKSSAKSRKAANGARRRTNAGKAAPFDRRKYATLLSRALPVVIATEVEYDQTIAEINRLLRKGEAKLSPEEDRLLDLLSTLAENWEEIHHPIPEAPGYRILKHYMQVRGMIKTTAWPASFGAYPQSMIMCV